jgi:hypothetical protein
MKKHAVYVWVAGVAILTALTLGTALAQETTGTVSGTVKDESGAVIPGTTVQVRNVATGLSRSVSSDAQGRYQVSQLSPGSYEIESSSAGFQSYVRSGVELTVGRHAVVDIVLKVGAMTQKVEVTGEAPLVNTTTAATSGLIGEKEIRELPLNGRNYVQLTLLEPGVVQSRSAGSSAVTGGGMKLNFNGARSDSNNYIVDGTSANSVNQQAIGGASGQAMGVEAIQEFQVLTSNYSAEFGRAGGGIINVVTKSGTNQLRGSAFEFLRNSKLDARNFFDIIKPSLKRNQFGGSLGGPLKRDKTFVFGAYEGLRERLGQTLNVQVPTVAARQGNLGTSGTVAVSEVVKPYLALWPLPEPGATDLRDGRAEFRRTAGQPTRQDYGSARVDHSFSSNNNLFGRYTIDDSVVVTPRSIANFTDQDTVRSQYATIGNTQILSPTLLNVFRFGFNRSTVLYDQFSQNAAVEDKSLWYFPNPSEPYLGPLGIGGLSAATAVLNRPKHRLDNVYQLVDTITDTLERHTLKFGAEYQRIQTNENDTNNGAGSYSFTNLSTFLTNQPSSFVGVEPGRSAVRGWRQRLFGMFLQDDFRLFPRLTLNLGVRWEFVTDPIEVNGRTAHYEGVFTTKLGDHTITGGPIATFNKKNISPRFGFAWDVAGDGKTSVRGGFGMYYQMLFRNYFFSSRFVPPWYTTLSADAPNLVFPHPLAQLQAQATTGGDFVTYKDGSMPYMMQWNTSVQRQLSGGTVIGMGYVGTRGLHLGYIYNPNVPVPDILPDGRYFYPANRPLRDPNFTSSVRIKSRRSSSLYNALQVKANHRFTRGLQAQVAYTWSHSLDMGSAQLAGDYGNSAPSAQNPWNIKDDWSHSAFDLRHVVSANYTYQLPFGAKSAGIVAKVIGGWQTNGILNLTSGVPFTVQNNGGLNRTRQGNGPPSRPDLVPGMSNNPIEGTTAGCAGIPAGGKLGTPDLWYDPCAFRLQELGFYGNLGRNTVIGPKLRTFDFALVKNTPFGESRSLQFRWEVFNLFNRANFDLPNSTNFLVANGTASSTAGRISAPTVTPARQMQFGLKLSF